MMQKVQVVAFEGGALRRLERDDSSREAVVALPLGRLLTRILRVPADVDAQAVAASELQAINPFPDETLTVSVETISESPAGKVVLAAAMPESSSDNLGEALDAAKLSVMRIDALVLGRLRCVWGQLGVADGARRLVAFKEADGLSALVLDDGLPSAIRAISAASDLTRETMLLLLEAESFGGARPLSEVALVLPPEVTEDEKTALRKVFEPFGAGVRVILQDADTGLVGVAERTDDAGALNALPGSWRDMLTETRFTRKLTGHLLVAGAVLLLALGVLFGVPIVYDQMAKYQKGLSREHSRKYAEVKEMKAKTDLVKEYSDHTRGALEVMKAVSDRLPEDIELTSWSYTRRDGVTVAGEAQSKSPVYDFKDAIDAVTYGDGEDDEPAERVFPKVSMDAPSASKNGYRFSLVCGYAKEDAE